VNPVFSEGPEGVESVNDYFRHSQLFEGTSPLPSQRHDESQVRYGEQERESLKAACARCCVELGIQRGPSGPS
jgi:hypothetical protein